MKTVTIHSTERLVSALDFARLLRLGAGVIPAELRDALDGADVVTPRDVPADLVTIGSQVELTPADTGVAQVVTLRYPHDEQPVVGRVSALSPMGAALLGLRVGEIARWRVPGGAVRQARIDRIVRQPEAEGDFGS